jgi:hypothetical protein
MFGTAFAIKHVENHGYCWQKRLFSKVGADLRQHRSLWGRVMLLLPIIMTELLPLTSQTHSLYVQGYSVRSWT